ncbi:hypothetical protein DK867_20080 [Ochrobactrum sp. POC9]|uniref:hypothetical protein n=1 Tax=unclassified Ochrobactrum TaxID=239106 RepID=UPI000D70771B|nr:hypothetical protein [Ochrobactrum sp. POC9]MCH4542753.1 hypothetical protein [Ochrobactrum sp. A-1]PWU71295.1 hypothetical protein DK867_20080 [Ochrobactrum sp. POC9]
MQHIVPANATGLPVANNMTIRASHHQPRNLCAMVIDGEAVWVDINRYDETGRAVIIEHDGRIRLMDVEQEYIGFRPFGARTALGQRFKSPHGGVARNSVIVVGMVIDAPIRGGRLIEGDLS